MQLGRVKGKVLITGARGFVGRHCLPLLVDCGYEVLAITHSNAHHPTHSSVTWHNIDLVEEPKRIVELCKVEKPTHLLHLGWYTEHGKYWDSIENIRWLSAGLYLIDGFAQYSGRRAVLAGTCAEYDWSVAQNCNELITPTNPDSLYGQCKNALRIFVEEYAARCSLSWGWGRIFFAYGPGEPANRLIPSIIRALLERQTAKCSEGKQVRDFIYVEDVAAAFVRLLESNVQGPVNIGSGTGVPLADVALATGRLMDQEKLISLGAVPAKDEAPYVVASPTILFDKVGFTPKHTLEEGLRLSIDWWNHQVSPQIQAAGSHHEPK